MTFMSWKFSIALSQRNRIQEKGVTAGIDPGLNYLYTIAFDDFSEGVLVSTKTSQSNV